MNRLELSQEKTPKKTGHSSEKVDLQVQSFCNYFEKSAPSHAIITNDLLKLALIYDEVFVSQARLGDGDADIGREHTNRIISKLKKAGILTKVFRLFSTSTYKVHPALFTPQGRRKLGKYLPILKGLLSLLLLASLPAYTSNKAQITPSFKKDSYYYNTSNCIRYSSPYYSKIRDFFKKRTKRKTVMSNITQQNRKVCLGIGGTDYAALLFSAYTDEILAESYKSYRLHKEEVQNAVTWIWSHARNLCKKRGIEPYYTQMLIEVKAAGYTPGDRLLLQSDKDSQFRYDEPPVKKVSPLVAQTPPTKTIPVQQCTPQQELWRKMFPVPESIKNN